MKVPILDTVLSQQRQDRDSVVNKAALQNPNGSNELNSLLRGSFQL